MCLGEMNKYFQKGQQDTTSFVTLNPATLLIMANRYSVYLVSIGIIICSEGLIGVLTSWAVLIMH